MKSNQKSSQKPSFIEIQKLEINPNPEEMNACQQEFIIKEYESLRSEIEFLGIDLRKLEERTIISTAATWAWLFTQKDSTWGISSSLFMAAWIIIPLIIWSLSALRAYALYTGIKTISRYLTRLEKTLGVAGWETNNWSNTSQTKRSVIPSIFKQSLIITWATIPILVLVSGLFIALQG